MADTVYSFKDYNINIVGLIGSYSTMGEGLGSLTVTMTTAKSAHSVGADGSVMTSKIAGDNGTLAITCQQTSALNTWLVKLYNACMIAPSSAWTSTQILVTNNVQKEVLTAIGCSFEKLADRPMQAEGQMITWNILAQNVTQLTL